MRAYAPALSSAALAVGALAILGLWGASWLEFVGAGWRQLFGWLAWPLAVLLLAVGARGTAASQRGRELDVPWAAVIALEVVVAAVAALLALAFDADSVGAAAPADGGAGGLVGWALATTAAEVLGRAGAIALWFALGCAALFPALGLGRGRRAATPELREPAVTPAADRRAKTPAGKRTPAGAPTRSGGQPPPAAGPQEALPPAIATAAGVARSPSDDAEVSRRTRGARVVGLPPLDIWVEDAAGSAGDADAEAMAEGLKRALASFGVPVDVVDIERGPTVTRFGVVPGVIERDGRRRRIRVARITSLRNDLALALSAPTVRIEAPVPGRPMVGIEIPNPRTTVVGMRGLLADPAFRRISRAHRLALPLGRSVSGEAVISDLGAMPHLLIAGATGSGKSVCVGAILCGLMAQNTPDQLRLVLVDPKRVEMARFGRMPHLLARVVHDPEEVVGALRWALAEMDARYRRFAERRARDLGAFNRASPAGEAPLPSVVMVIDELADLMLTAPHDFEPLLTRIAQLGRATGFHLVLATQRPSVDVLTGLIKANVPARIAFAVASQTDSRVILDQPGAEMLQGRGDMLFLSGDAPRPRRAQGAFASDAEIDRLAAFWADSHWPPPRPPAPWLGLVASLDADEELFEKAAELATRHGRVSASFLQRRLRVGYRKARELYDRLRDEGLLDVDEADDLPTS